MNLDVGNIVEIVYQFGALPIMLFVIWKLYKINIDMYERLKDKNKEIIDLYKENNKEIREIEKENIGLLHKTLSALNKIRKDRDE